MKNKILIYTCFVFLTTLLSCESDFLDRTPYTEITKENFFKRVDDLKTYTNGFYSLIGESTNDLFSDNISLYTGSSAMNSIVMGQVSSNTAPGGWSDWGTLRTINFLLDNYKTTEGDPNQINHYVGIAKFFRARFYYNKVKMFSDVPWYDRVLTDSDTEELYKTQDKRTLVVDRIMEDLEFSVKNISEDLGTKTRLNRFAALTSMAQICLHEGTFRKYHPELNLQSTANFYLEKAIWACEEIIKSKKFDIHGSTINDYTALFTTENIAGFPEIILQREYNGKLGKGNDNHSVLGWQWSLSKALVDSYLMIDGKPVSQVEDYQQRTFLDVFTERDPRLKATVAYPGFKKYAKGAGYVARSNYGGYDQLKFYPPEGVRGDWGKTYTSMPIFRYAEVLLIYAEALAETNKLTSALLNNTVNKIKSRVGMPPINMAKANANIDPDQERLYPNVTGVNKGIILEIRRERRVELACEGKRADDLKRWANGERFADSHLGMYVPEFGAYDMSGDGIYDIAILQDGDDSPLANLSPEVVKNITKYYLKKDAIYLTEGNKGFIGFATYRDNPRLWVNPTYYYYPIPNSVVVINPNLKQPFGWK